MIGQGMGAQLVTPRYSKFTAIKGRVHEKASTPQGFFF